MKKLGSLSIFLAILLILSSPLFAREGSSVQLTVLHVNDLHGHLLPYLDKSVTDSALVGSAARLARMIEDERSKDSDGTLLLAAGDMFQGTPISNIFRGQSVIEVMNYLRFDAMAIGNHELDWGLGILNQLATAAAFPFLSANIQDSQGKGLPLTKPYVILQRKKLKIAVIGITTPDTAFTTKPGNVSGLTFRRPAEVLPELLREVRSSGADLVLLLSHLGLDADREMAGQVSGIDVIVGGHSHTAVTRPVRVGKTIIVQAGSNGAYLGVLQLKIDPTTHRILDYTRENELQTVVADPHDPVDKKVADIVDRFNDQIKSEFARVVGESTIELVRSPHEESNVGDLICDALRETSGTDIAFVNGGGIRTDIPKGKITLDQVYNLLPFDDVLVIMDLTGEQIRQVLEQNANSEHAILQISGMTVKYDLTRPVGSRIIEAKVADTALQPLRTYRVVTNDFLAAGGDQYATFKEGKNVVYGDSLRDAFAVYLTKHSPVHPELQKRIVFVNR